MIRLIITTVRIAVIPKKGATRQRAIRKINRIFLNIAYLPLNGFLSTALSAYQNADIWSSPERLIWKIQKDRPGVDILYGFM
jgi:hypothetical protein